MTEDQVMRKFKRELPVELTDEEKIKKGHKSGQLKKKIEEVQAEMKVVTSGHKERIKDLKGQLNGILDDLESGTEVRKVDCFERKDLAKKKVDVVRADTNEVVDTRAMAFEELQTEIPGLPRVTDVDDGEDPSWPAPKKAKAKGKKREAQA